MRTSTTRSKHLPVGGTLTNQQMEWMAQQVERGLATRSHARMLRAIVKDLSEPLYRAIASGTAGIREAAQVRDLLGIKR